MNHFTPFHGRTGVRRPLISLTTAALLVCALQFIGGVTVGYLLASRPVATIEGN